VNKFFNQRRTILKPIFVGYTNPTNQPDQNAPEHREKTYLTEKDLVTHLPLGIGATRSGKSKWLEWFCRQLYRQDIGFLLLDPQSDLSRALNVSTPLRIKTKMV